MESVEDLVELRIVKEDWTEAEDRLIDFFVICANYCNGLRFYCETDFSVL
jgi:hypothetical protein